MRRWMVLSDRLVAAGFIRPAVLIRGLQLSRPALRRSSVGLQPAPDVITQVEETVAAHHQLLEAFEASRAAIPPGQLLELDYNDLVATPLVALKRIYDHFDCPGWERAQAGIEARLNQARSYRADPVQLPAAAESRLQQLLASR